MNRTTWTNFPSSAELGAIGKAEDIRVSTKIRKRIVPPARTVPNIKEKLTLFSRRLPKLMVFTVPTTGIEVPNCGVIE